MTTTERWSDPKNHELYNMGHLLTAGERLDRGEAYPRTASVHHNITTKTTFLDVAIKLADYLVSVSKQEGGGPDAFKNTFNPSQVGEFGWLIPYTK